MNTKVYFTILDDTVSTDAMYLASAPERRAKADALRLESDKRLSLAAGLMIRKLLGGIPVVTGLHGKPRAEGVFFNYSHSGDVVMFAISDCEVGCDVQKIGEVRLGAARRAFSEEELKELESSILGASDKVVKLEYDLFTQIRAHLCENIARIRSSADSVSRLDAMLSLAVTAEKNGYVKPEVSYSDVINLQNGRHPVVERFTEDAFVPNDTYMDTDKNRLLLITGPNMAGKSTYMRQVALITIMAQIGS
ncbi:MAG: hypothetical protein J6X38_02225, partial [Abditibacteriota bacterium]|nr:hypothetical protein [Abditibacteriota bacterium]